MLVNLPEQTIKLTPSANLIYIKSQLLSTKKNTKPR
jgi:hypothetical protein